MDSILELCQSLDTVCLEECQQILDNPQDSTGTQLVLPEKSLLDQALVKFRGIKETSKDVSTITCLKKLCAHSVLTVVTSPEQEDKLLATRLIMVMSSLPSASAFGIINSNVMQAMLGMLNRMVGAELKSLQKKNSNNKQDGVSMDIQLDEPAASTRPKGSRASQRLAASQEEEEESETDVDDAEEVDPFGDAPRGSRSQQSAATAAKTKLKPQQLLALLQDMRACVALFAQQPDEHTLNTAADLFVSLMYLCEIRAEYAGAAYMCRSVLVAFATTTRASLISTYRSLMPILTLANRNPLLPDVAKIKRSCHKAAMNAMMGIIAASCKEEHLLVLEVTETQSEQEPTETSASSPGSPMSVPSTPGSPGDRRSSTGSTRSTSSTSMPPAPAALPLAHTCLVGVLQRVTLSPPDRAPIRQVLQVSLVEMVAALGDTLLGEAGLPAAVRTSTLRAIEHYLVFLSRLSRSSKVAHRAFSLDITAQLLSTTWLWDLTFASADAEDEEEPALSPCAVLLDVLQERCMDCSPAVRTRALGAIHDLLMNLSDDSSRSMMHALFAAAMGAKPARVAGVAEASVKLSLIDTIRERASDDKPQVRTKALQALSRALAMPWPRAQSISAEGSRSALEHANMLVTEEDLDVFASHCQDASLSVRKQAMQSLTELLVARPADALIQDMWVHSVVPMTFDAEASVANKVAESLHTLLYDNLMSWSIEHQHAAARSSSSATEQMQLERAERISLVWKLSTKITSMGMFKILKSATGIMVKQGYLTAAAASKSDTRSSSILAVIAALKFACCFHLDRAAVTENASLQTIRGCEPEEVARGAWILLESLVALESMTILNAKQESVKFRDFIRQAGSADFVVRCYRQKHAADAAVVWDEEDLRIFRVLEILGGNLTEKDSIYMKSQISENLQQMQCECHLAAAAMAVMLQLSKTEALEGLDPTSSEAGKAMVASVSRWAVPLASAVYGVLHMFALRTRPPLAKGETIGATTAVGQLMLDWLQESEHLDASLTMDVSAVQHASLTAHVLEAVQTSLFILGEISMLGFSMEEEHYLGNESAAKKAASSARSAEYFRLPVDQAVVDLVKILMGHALPVTAGASSVHRECPNKIRANAFVTMGKLCMRNKTLARAHVNIFLREVSSHSAGEEALNVSSLSAASSVAAAAAVRSNALLVLGDMCIRYTNLVDRHVDTMAQCLQDSDSLVRKNALILLTQLLLQDFLKWKGFLLYRFLALTVDSDQEIAEFSRNILQKTLSLKYPQLLTNHFTEALVILNSCTAHPAYGSIARTGVSSEGEMESIVESAATSAADAEDGDVVVSDAVFTVKLSKAQRFGVYAFMAENMDDEAKIQVSAKLVQDVLTAAVDSTTLLPQPQQKGKYDREKYAAFESVLEDTLTLLRSPHLKVGQKRGGGEDADDAAEEEVADGGAAANNPKAAFVRAKSKVLQKLSTQHLVSHTLPVVISLKHVLETTKSSLQGTLMEFLVSLVKNHKSEVEEALQFDPTLRSEIEYDLKQFERTKKDKLAAAIQASQAFSARKSPPLGGASRPGTVLKAKSPYLDLQQLPAQSVVKPSLRKSFGGAASRGRTPFDALKSPGVNLSRSTIKSALSRSGSRAVEESDDLDRLTFSQLDAPAVAGGSSFKTSADQPEALDINCPTQKLFADDMLVDGDAAPVLSAHKQSKRRSWGVVVDSLLPVAGISPVSDANTSRSSLGSSVGGSPSGKSPPKKKRCRKSNSPKTAGSASKSVSFGSQVGFEAPSENVPAASNMMPPPQMPPQAAQTSKVVNRGVSRVTMQTGSMLANISSKSRQDDAVNAFDRLLASASAAEEEKPVVKAQPRAAPAPAGGAKRVGRADAQRGDSLMGLM